MTPQNIVLMQGHPDNTSPHFGHALASAYAAGAAGAGHQVRQVDVSQLGFPLLRTQADWELGPVPPGLQQAQEDIRWANHIVIFFPLWLGDMPALLKGFLEQIARPGYAFERKDGKTAFAEKKLKGRSARVVVTMGMPALVYRWYFRAHSVKSPERNILGLMGIAPVHETLIGMVASLREKDSAGWLKKLGKLGQQAE